MGAWRKGPDAGVAVGRGGRNNAGDVAPAPARPGPFPAHGTLTRGDAFQLFRCARGRGGRRRRRAGAVAPSNMFLMVTEILATLRARGEHHFRLPRAARGKTSWSTSNALLSLLIRVTIFVAIAACARGPQRPLPRRGWTGPFAHRFGNCAPMDGPGLLAKVGAQGQEVRRLKESKADAAAVKAAVTELLALKAAYKELTGVDVPAPAKAAGKKPKQQKGAAEAAPKATAGGDTGTLSKSAQRKAEKLKAAAEKKEAAAVRLPSLPPPRATAMRRCLGRGCASSPASARQARKAAKEAEEKARKAKKDADRTAAAAAPAAAVASSKARRGAVVASSPCAVPLPAMRSRPLRQAASAPAWVMRAVRCAARNGEVAVSRGECPDGALVTLEAAPGRRLAGVGPVVAFLLGQAPTASDYHWLWLLACGERETLAAVAADLKASGSRFLAGEAPGVADVVLGAPPPPLGARRSHGTQQPRQVTWPVRSRLPWTSRSKHGRRHARGGRRIRRDRRSSSPRPSTTPTAMRTSGMRTRRSWPTPSRGTTAPTGGRSFT